MYHTISVRACVRACVCVCVCVRARARARARAYESTPNVPHTGGRGKRERVGVGGGREREVERGAEYITAMDSLGEYIDLVLASYPKNQKLMSLL